MLCVMQRSREKLGINRPGEAEWKEDGINGKSVSNESASERKESTVKGIMAGTVALGRRQEGKKWIKERVED